ncbi:MAG: hypothetical protein ACT4NL_00980 [Pseudomarimonas sp.]
MTTSALAVVALFGVYLIGLGVACLALPTTASRFLLGFASSPTLHLLEMVIRIGFGAAFVLAAPALRPSPVFVGFGWLLVVTSILLLAVPWRWHRRFAEQSVPRALQFLHLIGLSSVCIGGFILFAVIVGTN